MDQLSQQSTTRRCSKHQKKNVEFIQINDLSNSNDNHLFYCTDCVNKDLAFKGVNYLLISQILEEGNTNIVQKWPPVKDYSIIEELIQFTEHRDSSSSVIHQINQFFTLLKEEFLRKVDLCEKKMINHSLELPLGKESIISQYQQISQISRLRSILIEGEKTEAKAHEQKCRQFIVEIESQKEKNFELLSKLLKQCSEKEELVNFEYPNLIKNSIFTFIDEIDFFNTQKNPNSGSILINQSQISSLNISKSSQIMKLISNKSNFCSDIFLSQIKAQLDKLDSLFSNISFENLHEQNKTPIDFSGLSEQNLDMMRAFVDHQTKIRQSREYSVNILQSHEYQQVQTIIDSNTNFLENNLKSELKKYLVDTFPLLKQINFSNERSQLDNEKFNIFNSLSESDIEDLFELIKMRQQLNSDNEYYSSKTGAILESTKQQLSPWDDVEDLFRKYPIYDLMKRKEIIDLKFEAQFEKTGYQDGYNRIDIFNNNQVSINSAKNNGQFKNGNSINCVSNIILEKQNKYIFRFEIKHERNDSFNIFFGLIKNGDCHTTSGHKSNLCCRLNYNNTKFSFSGNYGIQEYQKGNKLILSQKNEIEMRVWLGGQQLEILDYPGYECKLGVADKEKLQLTSNDLRLYVGMAYDKINVTLTSALIVKVFPN